MKTWIVVPTYNEADNLEPLLRQLFALAIDHVLIVDDNSPDGTGQLADSLRARWPKLEVLHRPQRTGLSDAYQQGLRIAIDRGADRIIHMDADGSHDPVVIPALLEALQTADVAIGSRYVGTGSLQIPLYRRWISVLGNGYIRLLLGRGIHDWSSGFKAWRGTSLATVLQAEWGTRGYACLMVMSWLALRAGARFQEVPITFTDRERGQSKFSAGIMLEDLKIAWQLRTGRLAKRVQT